MPTWKLNIFVNAVLVRYDREEGTITDIIDSYTKLTESEKSEINNVILSLT